MSDKPCQQGLFLLMLLPMTTAATVEHFFTLDAFLYKGYPVVGINQVLPSPTITVAVGDRLIVHLTNALKLEGASIHWHGFEMRGAQVYDGVVGVTQCEIAPGSTFTYNFTVNEVCVRSRIPQATPFMSSCARI